MLTTILYWNFWICQYFHKSRFLGIIKTSANSRFAQNFGDKTIFEGKTQPPNHIHFLVLYLWLHVLFIFIYVTYLSAFLTETQGGLYSIKQCKQIKKSIVAVVPTGTRLGASSIYRICCALDGCANLSGYLEHQPGFVSFKRCSCATEWPLNAPAGTHNVGRPVIVTNCLLRRLVCHFWS